MRSFGFRGVLPIVEQCLQIAFSQCLGSPVGKARHIVRRRPVLATEFVEIVSQASRADDQYSGFPQGLHGLSETPGPCRVERERKGNLNDWNISCRHQVEQGNPGPMVEPPAGIGDCREACIAQQSADPLR
ncbi:hypothetical protein D3C78_1208440 [compost metagenome]